MPKNRFDHEKLEVYQRSLDFIEASFDIIDAIPKSLSVSDQLDRASTSIPLNIAEGNGKYTPKDRCRFFDNARGSALECAACIDVLERKKIITTDTADRLKEPLVEIVSMLVGLIKSQPGNRIYEIPESLGNEED